MLYFWHFVKLQAWKKKCIKGQVAYKSITEMSETITLNRRINLQRY